MDVKKMTKLLPAVGISQLLKLYNVRAKKDLGQNFLMDNSITKRLVGFLGPGMEENDVLEIGPGPGMLTRAILLQGARRLVAVEKDTRFSALLDPLTESAEGRLRITYDDAIHMTPSKMQEAFQAFKTAEDDKEVPKARKLQIIANLPFNVAPVLTVMWLKWMAGFPEHVTARPVKIHGTKRPLSGSKAESKSNSSTMPVVDVHADLEADVFSMGQHFMATRPAIDMLLVFQKEVAKRICAAVDSPGYSRISVLAQYVCDVQYVYEISGSRFVPQPTVDAGVVLFKRKEPSSMPIPVQMVSDLATLLFNAKRKLLHSNLGRIFGAPMAERMMHALHLGPDTRTLQMSVQHFIKLATFIRQHNVSF